MGRVDACGRVMERGEGGGEGGEGREKEGVTEVTAAAAAAVRRHRPPSVPWTFCVIELLN